MSKITQLTPRREVIDILARFRGDVSPEKKGRRIDQSTFWRWCDLCGFEARKTHFDNSEVALLREAVYFFESGGRKAEFEKYLIKREKDAQQT